MGTGLTILAQGRGDIQGHTLPDGACGVQAEREYVTLDSKNRLSVRVH